MLEADVEAEPEAEADDERVAEAEPDGDAEAEAEGIDDVLLSGPAEVPAVPLWAAGEDSIS